MASHILGEEPMPPPCVFISYSHDSPEHVDRVLALADQLRADGIDCILDEYETAPPEGWTLWMDRHIRKADFVLMICTEAYCRRVMGEEEPGVGRGVKWEGNLIYQHIYDADARNTRFIPVLFEGGWVEYIPTPLKATTHYLVDTPSGYEALYRRLSGQPYVERPDLGDLKKLSPRERQTHFFAGEPAAPDSMTKAQPTAVAKPHDFIDREAELKLFEDILQRKTRDQVLALLIKPEHGKTYLMCYFLGHCQEQGIPVALVDFAIGQSDVVSYWRFVSKVCGQLGWDNFPGVEACEELHQTHEGKGQSARQQEKEMAAMGRAFRSDLARICAQERVVLLLDAYEQGSVETRNWIDEWLFCSLPDHYPNLIVVVAGRPTLYDLGFLTQKPWHALVRWREEFSMPKEEDVQKYIEIWKLDVGHDFRAFMKTACYTMGWLAKLRDVYRSSHNE